MTTSNYNGYAISCHGSEDGSINLNVSGGTAPYSFTWNTTNGSAAANGATTQDLSSLKAGTYTVIVNDSVGAADTLSATLASPTQMLTDGMMSLLPSGQYYSCDTCADGSGMLVVSGGVSPYSFVWSAGIAHTDTDTSTTASNFSPDTEYTLTIADANGCSVIDSVHTQPYTVAHPLEIFGTLSSYAGGHQVSTYNGTNGWIDLQVVGGTVPYDFSWSNNATTQNVSNLSAGTYTVTVSDAGGQQAEKSFTLSSPANPLAATLTVQNPLCHQAESGELTASVSGGTPPYTFLWNTSNGSAAANGATTASITSLSAGSYSVLIQDANNDSLLVSDTIVSPSEIQSSIVPSVDEQGYHLLCAEGSSVTLDLSASGGTPPYTYLWDNGKFTQDVTVEQPGPYMVQIKDSNNCIRYDSLLVVAPQEVEIEADWHTYPNGQLFSCDTCNDAQVTIGFTGGVPPYSFSLSSASQTLSGPVFTGIYADTSYALYFEDAIGCVLEMSGDEGLTIPRGGFSSLDISSQVSQYPGGYNISSFGGNDGWIEFNIHGEMSQPTVVWSDGATGTFRDSLSAGFYEVTVSDNAGQSITRSWTLIEPQNSLMVQISGNYSHCMGSGNLNAMVNGGTPPYTYQWIAPDGMLLNEMWASIDVWQQGLYSLWVTDANNDSAFADMGLHAGEGLWAEVHSPTLYGNANASCNVNDGSMVIHFHGGMPPYQVWLKQAYQDNQKNMGHPSDGNANGGSGMPSGNSYTTTDSILVIDSLAAGQYHVEVSDMSNCGGQSYDIELISPPPLAVKVIPAQHPNGYYVSCDTCHDGTASLQVTGAYGALQYAWAQVPEEYADTRLEGASMFGRLDSDDVDPAELFSGNMPFVIGSSAQQTGLSSEVMYAGFVMDELGCFGGEEFSFEKPKPNTDAPPAWGLYGNDANGAASPPLGEPEGAWLGTSDSTDVVMKVNNQPQLRLRADGTTEVMQQLRMSALEELVADTSQAEPRILVLRGDGSVAAAPPPPGGFLHWWADKYNATCWNNHGTVALEVMGTWSYDTNEIYTCPQVSVGIGTDEPLAKMDVRGQTYSRSLSVNTYGQDAKVTIKGGQPGTQNQLKALEVQNTDGEAALQVYNDGRIIVGAGNFSQPLDSASIYLGDGNHSIRSVHGKGLSLSTYGAQDALVIEEGTGKVMIGDETITSGPHTDAKLSVDGKIIGRELFIHNEQSIWGWPDYVFADDYDLRSIEELKTFIDENEHLPGVADAKTIKENGIGFSATTISLLEKVEELSLYVILLNDKIKELEKKLKDKH